MTAGNVYKWSAIERVGNSALTFGGNVLLANLLTPSDFGLLGMVAIFSAVALNLSDCGMGDGLVHKLNPTEDDYGTLFVFNSGMGLLFGLIFVLLSGVIADFFHQPELHGIMIAIGICFFVRMLSMVHETRMRKELNFKTSAIVRLSSTSLALIVAIILVKMGFGYWGIVSMQVFINVFLTIFYYALTRWMPSIIFSVKSFREMYGFGIHLMLAFLCAQVARNINTFVIGKYQPASSAGVYSQAQKMEEVPYGITESILTTPLFSILSSTSDKAERIAKSIEIHSVAVFLFSLVTAMLFVLAPSGFNTLFGSKWDEAIPVFRILLFFGLAVSLKSFYITILKSSDRTKTIRNLTVGEVVMQLALLCFTYNKGISVIAFAQLIPAIIVLAVYVVLYLRTVGQPAGAYLRCIWSAVWLPLTVFASGWILSQFLPTMMPVLTLCCLTAICLLTLVAVGELSHNYFYCYFKRLKL